MWCQAPNSGFTARHDPAEATLGDLAADMAQHGLAFSRPVAVAAEPTDTTPVLIGDVFGLVVRARNVFSNLGAQLRTVAGGEAIGYTKLLTASRNQARERMWQEARGRGANAVVAMRFDCNEIGDIMSEVAAYGTAVTAEPSPSGAD
jgi:uncharacterized protein YbjQ (UPF0145 family)